MNYRAWLATFQTHEAAARSAYQQVEALSIELSAAQRLVRSGEIDVAHWQANHAHMVRRCGYMAQRKDLPVDRIPAFQRHVTEIEHLQAEVRRLQAALASENTNQYRIFCRLRDFRAPGAEAPKHTEAEAFRLALATNPEVIPIATPTTN